MGRSPGPVSLLSNVPPAVSAVGAPGCAARRSRGPRPGPPRRRLFWICRKPSSMGASHQRSREAPAWARRSAGRARRSWRSPIAADSPSRFTSRVPRRTKSPWSTQPVCQAVPCASHRGQRLRVGPPGCRPGPPRRGTDRPAPQNTNIADPRRSPAASLPTEVEDRATLCLVPEFSAARCPLRALRRELSCDATPRLLRHSLARFMT